MDSRTSIEPVTVLKTKSAQLIRQARETRQPIIITQNGKASAVLQDIESVRGAKENSAHAETPCPGRSGAEPGEGINHARLKKETEKKIKELRNA